MSGDVAFEPKWASAPGETIVEALRSRGGNVEDLADRLGVSDAQARGLVTGDVTIDEKLAGRLAEVVGGSTAFWLAREQQFRESTRWLDADMLTERLPFDQMVSFGWIDGRQSWRDRASVALEYFDVSNTTEWNATWRQRVSDALYRASHSQPVNETAVAAWLRQVELQAANIATSPWSPSQLRGRLPQLRHLSRLSSVESSLEQVRTIVASCGVALVVVRAPKECPISGASYVDSSGVRVVALSARYRSDDHLWFTLFHEFGHVLLHDATIAFLDELEIESQAESSLELEADTFAQEQLVPGGLDSLASSRATPSARDVLSFAAHADVAAGVVVGQLQHIRRIGFDKLNRLKRRYTWDGPSLKS